ncbi:unnamed protein product [Ectocarpus fasciculatus]
MQHEEGHEEEGRRGKRKLRGTAEGPRRCSVPTAGSRRPTYAESPRTDPSKRLRKASELEAAEKCGGGGAGAVPKPSTPVIVRRHGQGRRRRCQEPECTTWPSYGIARLKKAEFCKTHAKQGMVDVVNKKCGHPGCITIPSFGANDSKKAEFCKTHAKPGMVNVVNKKCGNPGCLKRASYGETGRKKVEFCKTHAKKGMVIVCTLRCIPP